jgi:tRNA G46 methylase TrmB
LRAVRQRHGQDAGRDRHPPHQQHSRISATRPNCWTGCPDAALAGADILYPDPWPKRRHWKRRIVRDETIAALARVLCGGGEVHFATDIADYAAWTLERFARTRAFRWTAECAADWREPWPGYVPTRYEAKARLEGRASSYFVFRREDRLAHTTTR